MKQLALVLGVSSLLAATPLAQRKIWVVDDNPGPGVDFAAIQPAIAASSAGDLVLVRDGNYAPFTIASMGLSVVADDGANVVVQGVTGAMTTLVTGIPAGSEVVMRGIHFRPPDPVDGDLVRIEASAGVVWLEDVVLEPTPITLQSLQTTAMRVDSCAKVVLTRVDVHGVFPGLFGGNEVGSNAIRATQSELHLFDCDAVAGGTFVSGGLGIPAIRLDASFATLRESRVTGGPGGDGYNGFSPASGGKGGPGVALSNGSYLWSVGSIVSGGPGGFPSSFGGSFGVVGPRFTGEVASVVEHPAADVRFQTQTMVRTGQLGTFVIHTEPNARVFALTAGAPDPVFSTTFPGVIGVGLAPIVTKLGVTDASGQLTFTTPVVTLAPQRDFRRFTFQLAAITSTGVELSEPSLVQVVQPTF